jgi:hypothetical protein
LLPSVIFIVVALLFFLQRRTQASNTTMPEKDLSRSEPQAVHEKIILHLTPDGSPTHLEPMDAAIDNRGPTRTTSQAIPLERSVPSAPSGVTATAGDGEITISWNSVLGAISSISYHLYWSTIPNITKQTGNRFTNVTSPFKHLGLSNGTTYYYVVTAMKVDEESEESDEVSAKPVPPQAPTSSFTWRIDKEK